MRTLPSVKKPPESLPEKATAQPAPSLSKGSSQAFLGGAFQDFKDFLVTL